RLLHPATGRKLRPAFVLERVSPGADDPDAVQQQRFDLSERVQRGELFGFIEIGPDVCLSTKADDRAPSPLPPLPPGNSPIKTFSTKMLEPERKGERAYLRYQTDRIAFQEFPIWAEEVLNQAILKQRWVDAGMPSEKLPSLRPIAMRTEGLTRR